MILKIRNGIIYGDYDQVIGSLIEPYNEEVEKTIECGSEALPAIEQFISDVNSGSLKPRSAVKSFEKILEKYQ